MLDWSTRIAWSDAVADAPAAVGGTQQTVRIDRAAYEDIIQHVSSDLTREHAGLLFGYAEPNGLKLTNVITAHRLPAAAATLTHVLMRREAWPEVWRQLAAAPQLEIAGWYHSHPGHGVFLSETDSLTQSTWFRQPWQVALVVDPVQGQVAAFVGPKGRNATIHLWDR